MPNETLPTRKQYINGYVTHQQYYASVAREAGIKFGADHDIVKRAAGSTKRFFNDVPLEEWTSCAIAAKPALTESLLRHGDAWSLFGGVCAIKASVWQALGEFGVVSSK